MLRPLTIVSLLAVCCALAGCGWLEPKAKSPFTGQPATLEQIQTQADRYAEQLKIDSAEDQRKAQADIARIRREAERRAKTLVSTTQAQVEEIEADATEAAGTVVEGLAAKAAARTVDLSAMQAGTDAAIEDINRQNANRSIIVQGVQTAAQFIPGPLGGIIAGGVAVLAGGGVAAARRMIGTARTAAEVAEAKAQRERAERERIAKSASLVIDAIDALKLASPEVKEAFKANAPLLNEWMGDAGKALVDELQRPTLKLVDA